MKSGAVHHIKMKRLRRLLSVRPYEAVGIMESIWHVTAENAPDGGLGKFSDEEIAEEIGWEGDPAALVNALVEAGWLDRDGETYFGERSRLAVHDWRDHMPEYLKERLRKQVMRDRKREIRTCGDNRRDSVGTQVGPARDASGTNEGQSRECAGNVPVVSYLSPGDVPSIPNQTKPNQTKDREAVSGKKKRGGPLASIDAAMLRDTGRLLKHHDFLANLGNYGCVRTEASQHRFVSAAEHALRTADDPVKLFVSNLSAGRWHIVGDDEDRASARIREHLRGVSPSVGDDPLAAAANRMAAPAILPSENAA